jgi:hypothetical protein
VHVPYGAGDREFEKAYSLKLKPFISALYKFPRIQGTLHYSGAFLSWVDRVYPECTMSIDDLVSRKQVELLGGGFYEPRFTLIPLQDKIGQVEMLTTYLRKRFGKKPQGCWLPALSWEQNMVGPLLSCGMAYTFLGEDQFRQAGLSGEDLYAPCISEDQGKLIAVFPISRPLEAFFNPEDQTAAAPFLDNLSKLAGELPDDGSRVAAVFPDPCRSMESSGEAELYWHRFFQDLADSSFDFTTPGRFIKGREGLRKAYFPGSADRQYLIDYPEANGIYAKMVFSHMLINQLRGDKARKRTALEELWKAQGYDAFCPAESGGIFRGDLRKSAFRSMLEAEKITRENGTFIPCLMNFDFDLDNEDEYLFQGDRINCYVRLEGAGMFELDYLPRSWNYLDTLAQPRNLGRRAGFSDLILPAHYGDPEKGFSGLEEALNGSGGGIRRCAAERFLLGDMDKARCKAKFILPERDQGPFRSIGMEKYYQLRKDTLMVNYCLRNSGEKKEERFCFAPVMELSFPGDGEEYQQIFSGGTAVLPVPPEGADAAGVRALKFRDIKNETVINLEADKPFQGRITPIYCQIPGKDGVSGRGAYQSTRITPLFSVRLGAGESWKLALSLKFTD